MQCTGRRRSSLQRPGRRRIPRSSQLLVELLHSVRTAPNICIRPLIQPRPTPFFFCQNSLSPIHSPARRHQGSSLRMQCTGRRRSIQQQPGHRRIPRSLQLLVEFLRSVRTVPNIYIPPVIQPRPTLCQNIHSLPLTSSTASGQQSLNAVHRSSQKHPAAAWPPQNPSQLSTAGGAPPPSPHCSQHLHPL